MYHKIGWSARMQKLATNLEKIRLPFAGLSRAAVFYHELLRF